MSFFFRSLLFRTEPLIDKPFAQSPRSLRDAPGSPYDGWESLNLPVAVAQPPTDLFRRALRLSIFSTTTALLRSRSDAPKRSVTLRFDARRLSSFNNSRRSGDCSSCRYFFSNAFQRSGLWPNHLRSALDGPISRSHRSSRAVLLETPRGHKRSTRTRVPSDV
jgi:hypothetical protein